MVRFLFFYAAASLLAVGANPLEFEDYRLAVASLGFPSDRTLYPFPYPPWALAVFYPLGTLSFKHSLACLLIGAAVLIGGASHLVYSMIPRPTWLSFPKMLLLTATFPPLWKNIFFGQVAWLEFVLLAAVVGLTGTKQLLWAGIVLSLITFKPQFAIVFVSCAGTWALRNKQWGLIVGFALGFLLQALVSAAIIGVSPLYLLRFVRLMPHAETLSPLLTAAPLSWLSQAIPPLYVNGAACLLLVFAGILIGYHSGFSFQGVFLIGAPVALAIAPYAWSHDYLLLFPAALCCALGRWGKMAESDFLKRWIGGSFLILTVIVTAEWLMPICLLAVFASHEFQSGLRMMFAQRS